MEESTHEIVLLVCNCEKSTEEILDKFYDAGLNVIGPAPNARVALIMAAQNAPTIALVASAPNGRRNASELASELMRTWGVRSWIPESAEIDGKEFWAPDDDRLSPIRRALHRDIEKESFV